MYTSDVNVRGSAEGIEDFQNVRPRLFRIAYRMLGRVPDAEDIVQDVWVRWQGTDRARVNDRVAFLVKTTTNAALNVATSARFRREITVGRPMTEWVPTHEDPTLRAERLDEVEIAVRLLVQRLSPIERAVFVLREVFDFGFPEVASAVGRSEAACRQLASRARRHMQDGRPRFKADRKEREDLASRFFDALYRGDVAELQDLLAADVTVVSDSGGKAPQLARAVVGADNVARLIAAVFPQLAQVGVTFEPHEVNGEPGAIFRAPDGKVLHTLALDVLDGRIQTIRLVINPDKLWHVGPVADAWAIVRALKQARRDGPSS